MSGSPAVPFRVVGLSHHTAAVGIRESLAFDPEEAADFLARGLREEAWTEAMLLSTCNRTELYAAPGPAAGREGALAARLTAARPQIRVDADGILYESAGAGAVRHLVRVACGLDSMILGESEILAQVKEAHRIAKEAGTAGPMLERVVPAALKVSRRAREETGIHRGVTSVPAAALTLAKRHFSDFSRLRVLVVGAGAAGRIGARLFAGERPGALWITNRTPSRAVDLAAEVRAATWSWPCVEDALVDVDVVLCAVRAPEPILSYEGLRAAAKRRAGRMLVLLDIGVPRNVDPRARDLEGVFLHDVDSLERLVEQNREKRRAEVEKVEAMVEEALVRMLLGEERRAAEPIVAEIRRSLEELRAREVERSLRHFSPEQREHLDALTRSLMDKAFHAPMQSLREMGTEAKSRESWLRRFFGLRGPDAGEAVTRFRLGTRGSKLALWQASFTARALAALPRGPEVEVVILKTKGDAVTDRPIADVGSTGVFVKELEEALLRGEIDLAVHSLKDLETRMPAGLTLAAVTKRAHAEDVLVAAKAVTVETLPEGATVATGSPRRKALLRNRRPDLRFELLRGNVPTRVERVVGGAADATVLARAGLERLGMTEHLRQVLDPVAFPPAPGQGALGIQCRDGDGDLRSILALLEDGATRAATTAERAFLRRLGSGCHLAAGAYGRIDGGRLRLDAFVGSAEGTELLRGGADGSDGDALGTAVAEDLLSRASADLVRELGVEE